MLSYNTWLLSNLLKQYEQNGDEKALEKIKRINSKIARNLLLIVSMD